MPIYVYKFVETGETIEIQQAFTDDALTQAEHPTSGELMSVKKVFQPVGVTFKGGGFYKTDSRGNSSAAKTTAAAPTPASTDGGASTSTSTTATPAATPAPAAPSSTPASAG
jgi:predicted nucleic acid-binding Zn ribbon protein